MATATGYGKKPTIGKRRISTGPRKSLIGAAVSMSKKDPAKAKALARASIGLGPSLIGGAVSNAKKNPTMAKNMARASIGLGRISGPNRANRVGPGMGNYLVNGKRSESPPKRRVAQTRG